MTAHLRASDLARLRRAGIVPLKVEEGIQLFDAAFNRPEAHLVPMSLDVARMQRAAAEGIAPPALLRALARTGVKRVSARRVQVRALREQLTALTEAERVQVLTQLVRAEVGAVLGLHGANAVDPNRELQKLGLDSLMAVELRNRLSALAGSQLPTTLAFDHPTPVAIARYILREKMGDLSSTGEAEAAHVVTRRDIELFAELLLRSTSEELTGFGLVPGLLKMRASSGERVQPVTADENEILTADTEDFMSFLESRLELDA